MADDTRGPDWEPEEGGGQGSGPPDEGAVPGVPEMPTIAPPAGRRPLALILVGILALAGAAAFAVVNLTGTKAGASTPEDAVRAMFEAVADEDVLGVLQTLPPGERESIRQPLTDLAGQLTRLDVLEKGFDLSKLKGVDLDFSNLELETSPIRDGLVAVKIANGTANYRVAPQELPLGAFLRDLIPPDTLGPPSSGSEPVEEGDDSFVVVVREGGRWYASLWYTAAEAARRDAGAPAPKPAEAVRPRGEFSPEKAIERLIRAAAAFDVQTMIELLPPDEGRALHEYAPLFLKDAKTAAADLQKRFVIDIGTIELSSKRAGDEAVVTIKRLTFRARLPGGGFLSFDGECFESGGFEEFLPPRICSTDLRAPDAPPIPTPEIGFIAVERGGSWYFSPTRTMLGLFTATLQAVERKDLDELKKFIRDITSGGEV